MAIPRQDSPLLPLVDDAVLERADDPEVRRMAFHLGSLIRRAVDGQADFRDLAVLRRTACELKAWGAVQAYEDAIRERTQLTLTQEA